MFKRLLSKIYTSFLKSHKTIYIAEDVRVDYRVEIESKDNITIEKSSIIYKNVTLYKTKQATFQMGEHSHISSFTYMLLGDNNLTFGSNNAIAPFCAFYCTSNAISKEELFKDTYISADIVVGDNVFIGSHTVVLPGSIIENNVVVASNSVVKGTLKSGYLYGGSPVKIVREL